MSRKPDVLLAACRAFLKKMGLGEVGVEWGTETAYDRVVVFCSSMYPQSRLPELKNIPLITDIVDVDSQKWFDYAAVSTGVKGLFKRRIFETEYYILQAQFQDYSSFLNF